MQKFYTPEKYWKENKPHSFLQSREACEAMYPNHKIIELNAVEDNNGDFYAAIKDKKINHVFKTELQVELCFPDLGKNFKEKGGRICKVRIF